MTVKPTKLPGERRDAIQNRERILVAASKLFDKYGVEKTSMKQIANEAHVGSGTLYRRFKNKSDLCWALIKDNIKQLFDNLENYLSISQSEIPTQRLRKILELFIDFREKKAQLLTGVEEAPKVNSLAAKLDGPIFSKLHQILVTLLTEINAQHATNEAIFQADILITTLSHDFYSYERESRHYSPEQILEQLFKLIVLK